MSFIVGRIENKFGKNGSFKQPNGFPIYAESQVVSDKEPSILDQWSGFVYLFGDQGNHCQYKGVYYALHIMDVLDSDRKYYRYRLEREYGFDALKSRALVTGDLANSNNDELLEANLSRTIGVLDSPANVIPINFENVEYDGRRNFSYYGFSTSRVGRKSISGLTFFQINKWIKVLKDSGIVQKTLDLYKKSGNPSTLILGTLDTTGASSDGKYDVERIIRKLVKDIREGFEDKSKPQVKISKVTDSVFGKLTGSYCITYRDEGIAVSEEKVGIRFLDLSGLTEIVPISPLTLERISPNKILFDSQGVPVGFDEEQLLDSAGFSPCYGKVMSKIRIPVGAERNFPSNPYLNGSWATYPFDRRFWSNGDPQKVVGKYKSFNGEFNLGGVKNLNFVIKDVKKFSEEIKEKYNQFPPYVDDCIIARKFGFSNFKFGFLIFQIFRDSAFWDGFEFKSTTKLKDLRYISGIKKSFLFDYGTGKFGGNRRSSGFNWVIPKAKGLNLIQPGESGTPLIAYYLENYLVTWASFFPSTNYPNTGSSYGYYGHDYGGVYAISGQSYIESAVSANLLVGGERIKNNFVKSKSDPTLEGFKKHMSDISSRELKYLCFKKLGTQFGEIDIRKGDLFFSNDEGFLGFYKSSVSFSFAMEDYRHVVPKFLYLDRPHLIDYAGQTLVDLMAVEDYKFFRTYESRWDLDESTHYLICLSKEGKFQLRGYRKYRTYQEISKESDDPENIVESADSLERKDSLFYHLPLLVSDFGDSTSKDFMNFVKGINGLKDGGRLEGFKKTSGTQEVRYTNYSSEELNLENNQERLLFDLVGTNGYALILKGRAHLIVKKEKQSEIFFAVEEKTNILKFEELEKKDFSLLEKINQKVKFQFYNKSYYLNQKLDFKNKGIIDFYQKSLSPTQTASEFDEYFIHLQTPFDKIGYENVSVPKEREIRQIFADQIAVERLQIESVRNQHYFDLSQERMELTKRRFDENIRRSTAQLELSKLRSSTGYASTVTGYLGGFAGSMATGALVGAKAGSALPGLGTAVGAVVGATVSGVASLLSGSGKMTKGHQTRTIDLDYKFPMMEKNIDMDRELNAAQLALNSLVIDTTFMDRQLALQTEANSLFNRYDNPTTSETTVLKKFLKDTGFHGRELLPYYLVVYMPTETQLHYLKSIKEEFGVMCDIPNIQMRFYDGMPADIIRFRNLDREAIKGIANNEIREMFLSRLMAGVHIVSIKEESRLLSANEMEEKIFLLNSDLLKKAEENRKKGAKIEELERKVETAKEEAKAECSLDRAQLEQKIKDIEAQLATATGELRKQIEDCEKEKEDLQSQLIETEKNLINLNKLNDTCNAVNTKKIKELEEQVVQTTAERENYKSQKELLETQKADVERQLRECVATGSDRVRKITQYEADIAGLKQDLDRAKKAAAGNCPTYAIDVCKLIKDMAFDSRYEIDMKERQSGLSAFTDICFEICHNLRGIRLSRIDQDLGSKYKEMQQLLKDLENLNRINPMPICEQAVESDKGSIYQDALLGQLANEPGLEANRLNTDPVAGFPMGLASILKNLKDKARGLPNLHAFKKGLDKLNMSTFTAQEALKDKFDEDPMLDHFFKHFYPGQRVKNLYKALFGLDMEFSLVKREFLNSDCSDDSRIQGKDPIEGIDEARNRFILEVKGVSSNEFRVPPTTNTIYFSDGGHVFIEPRRFYRYFNPLSNVIPGYYRTYYTYANNKLERSNIRGRALKNAEIIKKTAYYRGNRYGVGCKFRTEKFDSSLSGGWAGDGDSREVYFRVSEKDLFGRVNSCISVLDSNLKKISLPDHVQQRIDSGQDLIRSFSIRNGDFYYADSPEDVNGTITINLTKTFGKRLPLRRTDTNYRERLDVRAWKLMGVLDACKLGIRKIGTYDGLKAYQLEARYGDTSDDVLKNNKDFQYYFDDRRRSVNIIGENMFVDLRAFMSGLLATVDLYYYHPYPDESIFRQIVEEVEKLQG